MVVRRTFGWGLAAGTAVGIVVTTMDLPTPPNWHTLLQWGVQNLGHSIWFFLVVFVAFALHLSRLQRLLAQPQQTLDPMDIARLDQLIDIWTQLFIGIGVIWTAIGMRSALQAALSEPQSALADTAGNVLRDLVDGGILLALTTTIVGAAGGYLMRLVKTATIGAQLHAYYAAVERREVTALLETTQRIETRLSG